MVREKDLFCLELTYDLCYDFFFELLKITVKGLNKTTFQSERKVANNKITSLEKF
jgi:hypothetical protein